MKPKIPMSMADFSTAKVLVIGDVMLDRYWHGNTSRISPEAPVPVVHVQQQEERPGGAGNVALNIAALGAHVDLIGLIGQDEAGETVAQQLADKQVNCLFKQVVTAPTVTKLRVLSRHQQLIRLDFEQGFDNAAAQLLHPLFSTQLQAANALLLSDYGKGVLYDPQPLIQAARQAGKPVLVDPKGTDFHKYREATVITPNRTEFEAVVGCCDSQAALETKGDALRAELGLTALLITRSEEGMSLLRAGYPPLHLPAHAHEVYDVTGAGDTVIGVLAASLAAGDSIVNATALANLAAGLVVAKLGAATVTVPELDYALRTDHSHAIQDLAGLQAAIAVARSHGETIVMTNGCFDILHAGHVQYLQQAKALGHRLLVAVNDDASVKRLKGSKRPVNPLAARMAVLNALESVDWVFPFNEDTPENLICQVLPDILVKGGDYTVDQIAGGQCVLDNGGQVQVLNFLEGYSTTRIVEATQQQAGN